MKRAVLCVDNPQDFIPQLNDYSIMIINPNSTPARNQYLLGKSDYSLLITAEGEQYRTGGDYGDERVLWYTSGTTGDSKFCSFTQAQIDLMAARICQTYQITENDRYVSVMSLWHAHGQGFYWATNLAGCSRSFLSVKDIRSLPERRPTFVTAIPDVLRVVAQGNYQSLRFIRSASAPLPPELQRELADKFRVPVVEAFGMTEALSHCFTNPLAGEQRAGTVGLPDGVEADIVEGRLYIRGPTVAALDWYDTGDLADQDAAGYFRILGRSRDQINVRGLKLNPVSLEQKLMDNIDGLRDCVIFGSDAVKCLYVGDADPAVIRRYLIALGPHCRPVLLNQVDDVPISPSGKISRTWLDVQFP
jgi:acyl-coenzyme A synthetase/AMP-(fatty) acid ligase